MIKSAGKEGWHLAVLEKNDQHFAEHLHKYGDPSGDGSDGQC